METATYAGEKPMNRRQQAKAATRAKVLASARTLFEATGFEKATIRQIAKQAGLSTGAIFANFENKTDLYVAAYGHGPLSPEDGLALARLAATKLPTPLTLEDLGALSTDALRAMAAAQGATS